MADVDSDTALLWVLGDVLGITGRLLHRRGVRVITKCHSLPPTPRSISSAPISLLDERGALAQSLQCGATLKTYRAPN